MPGVLRPALRAALEAGLADPDVAVPPRLRRYIGFTRLTDRALRDVWRTLDEDDDLRALAVAAVERDGGREAVGEAGWLLLARPEGWEAALEALLAEGDAAARRAREERAEAKAARQLSRASRARDEAEAERASAVADAQAARAELSREREARIARDAELAAVRAELDRVADDRADAVRKLKRAEDRVAQRAARQRELEGEVAAARQRVDELARATGGAVPDVADRGEAVRWPDRAAVRERLAAAGRAAAALATALDDLERLIGGDGPHEAPAGEPAPPVRGRAPARRPLRVPVGVFDDSSEAAAHLVRHPGVLVLVDGWNVAMTGWPGLSKELQRTRLVEGLRSLEGTTSARVLVIFDSALDERTLPPPSPLRSVQVRFAPPGVRADDELLEAIDGLPAEQPVVLVTDDREVQAGGRRRGANVVPGAALLALL